jgi:D-lactate dehydrogenase
MARAFSMHVRVFDINKNSFLSEVVNFKYLDLDELFNVSDIITLHVPHNKYTHHMINKESIKKMKKGAILINTSRGSLVDTDALYEALQKGRLAGAALDVIEGEDIIKEETQSLHKPESAAKSRVILRDHKIFKMDNVVFTPHNAFNSKEALVRILDTTIENLNTDNKKIVE